MATYWVDNVNGAAGNAGTSAGAPKDIPQNLTLADGDVVYIKGTGTPYAIVNQFGWNLTARSNITISRWDGFPKPVLTSAASNNDITSSRLIGVPGGTSLISGIVFQNTFRGAMTSSTAAAGASLTVEDCDGYDIGVGLYGADRSDGDSLGAAFLSLTQSAGNRFASVRVRRCKVFNAGRSILHINADTLVSVEDCELRYPSQIPTVAGSSNHGDCIIVPVSCTLIEVRRNKLDHSNKDSKHCFNQSTSAVGSVVVEDNDIFGPLGNAVTQCKMIYSDAPAKVRRNRIYTGSLAIEVDAGGAVEGNTIILSGSGRGGVSAGDLERGVITAKGAGCTVQQNTILLQSGGAVLAAVAYTENTPSAGVVRNNAIIGAGATWRAGIKRASSGVTENHNGIQGATNAVVDASALPASAGANTITGDMQATADGRPRQGSPLLTAGADLGLVRDIDMRQGRKFIGAYTAATMLRGV